MCSTKVELCRNMYKLISGARKPRAIIVIMTVSEGNCLNLSKYVRTCIQFNFTKNDYFEVRLKTCLFRLLAYSLQVSIITTIIEHKLQVKRSG